MDVFVVPVGGDRYELYCEVPDAPVIVEGEEATGRVHRFVTRWVPARLHRFVVRWVHRLKEQFHAMLAEAERERRTAREEWRARGWFGRLHARVMRFVAESIAEQRLLWHLRGETAARLVYPDDLDAAHATAIMRRNIGRDFDKHQFWLIVDTLGLVGSFLLVPIPGPNLLLYYFGFRVVGHYLSLRGARQGLNVVAWETEASAPLTELRRAAALAGTAREARVIEIAHRLQLEHLATFFERTAIAQ